RPSGRSARWYPTAPPPGSTPLPADHTSTPGQVAPGLIAHRVVRAERCLDGAACTVSPVTAHTGGRLMGAVRWLRDRLAGAASGGRLAAGPFAQLLDLAWRGGLCTRGTR